MLCVKTAFRVFAVLVMSFGATASAADESAGVHVVVNRDYLPAALELIRGAKKSLRIIQYEYLSHGAVRKIEQAILDAAGRGVSVKMLVDDSVESSWKNVTWLAKKGIDIKLDETAGYRKPGDRTTHAKIILADDRAVIVGSTNFSNASIEKNNESNLLVTHPRIGGAVRAYFDHLWEKPAVEPDLQPVRTGDVEIWFNRNYEPNVRAMFQKATRRIHIVLYGLNVGPRGSKVRRLIDELKAAKDRGVDVRVLLDRSDGKFAQKNMEISREAQSLLEGMGIPFKFDSAGVITHSKIILVDDRAVIGGTNWGRGPLDEYNDCNIATARPAAVAAISDYLQRLWDGR